MLTIIGCGNANCSDDAAGIIVAQQLQSYLFQNPKENVKIFDAGTSGMDVMFMARGSSELIIIDASSTNSEPGAIYEVPGEELENLPEPSFNLHDFRWDNALYAGRKIFKDDFPESVTVYLIEAGNLDLGMSLSESVIPSVDSVTVKIKDIIDSY
tara:strand:+ start:7135 stop:7599 length:465 start_codon:yes stop_codon:yes gene_type:complete